MMWTPINLVVLLPVLLYKIKSKGEGQAGVSVSQENMYPPLPSYRLTQKTRVFQLSW